MKMTLINFRKKLIFTNNLQDDAIISTFFLDQFLDVTAVNLKISFLFAH